MHLSLKIFKYFPTTCVTERCNKEFLLMIYEQLSPLFIVVIVVVFVRAVIPNEETRGGLLLVFDSGANVTRTDEAQKNILAEVYHFLHPYTNKNISIKL